MPMIEGKVKSQTKEIQELITESEEANTDFNFYPDHVSNKASNVTDAMKARI